MAGEALSKLDLAQRVPAEYSKPVITDIIRAICGQVNQVSEGQLAGRYNAQASVPTGGTYAVGDMVPDSNVTVRGSVAPGVAASYVRLGWVCVAAGSPGTFVEMRVLTGS